MAPNKVCLLESFNAAWRSKAMRAVREKYGIVGEGKVFEVTYGENGWHPHLHVLLFHGWFLDITEAEERELVVTFWREFNKQLAKWATKKCQHPDAAKAGVTYTPVIENGRPTGRRTATFKALTNAEWYGLDPNQVRDADLAHGINFVPITPDGEAGGKIAAYVGKIQLEMTRSDLKTGKTEASRSVFQMMNDYGHENDPADRALIREVADVLKGVQLVSWTGAFHGDPLYGEPTDEFADELTAAYYESQGLEPPDAQTEAIGGTGADVHRAADRANTPDGYPLLWRARIVLEQTGRLEDVAAHYNEVLAAVYVDRDTELPYPIIRFADPPIITIDSLTVAEDLETIRDGIRRLGNEQRQQIAEQWSAGANDTTVSPGERRQAPPGGWLNHWRNMTNDDLEAHAALTKKLLQPGRDTDHGG